MKKYDLIVLGAGPAGTPAAMAAATFGKKVLLIDKREKPGGECLFEGCIPSKVLENAANRYAMLKDASEFHVALKGTPQIHWEEVLKDKEEILKRRSTAAFMQMQKIPTLDYMQAEAKFINENTIEANGESFTFAKALIATGGKVNMPPFKGNGVEKAWTNRDVFFEEKIPKEIVFVGAGAISCELAGMFNELGVDCTILERGERILKRVDGDAAIAVQERMIRNGVKIELNIDMGSIDFEDDIFRISFIQEAKKRVIQSERTIIATGRVANVENIGLDKIGVEFDKHGVKVDATLQTTKEHIYACGDCIDAPRFAHTATYEAGIAVHNIFGPNKHSVDYSKNSWVLFTNPQIASVGVSEEKAKKQGLEVDIEKYDYKIDAKAQIDKEELGFIKFIIDKKSGTIIGIQILSEDAASLAGEAALIVANKMSFMNILGAIHPHPTLTEGFGKLAQQIFFKAMMKKK
jgi:dihydrolipoamide dehydrogenase